MVIALLMLCACSSAEFTPANGQGKPEQSADANPEFYPGQEEIVQSEVAFGEGIKEYGFPELGSEPSGGIVGGNGKTQFVADYRTCASNANAGRRGFGQCGANEVVVAINDGDVVEMSCCPLQGENILSTKAEDQHILRRGLCQPGEVLTGMKTVQGEGYCTKLNANFLQTSAPINIRYVDTRLSGDMRAIARSYNKSDTCVCPDNAVLFGGHVPIDNQCRDKCVFIELR